MKDQPRAPSLEQLRSQICWWWVICERCLHWVPVALVPLIIRWGANASSDRLRRSARCGKCSWKGATFSTPVGVGVKPNGRYFQRPIAASSMPIRLDRQRRQVSIGHPCAHGCRYRRGLHFCRHGLGLFTLENSSARLRLAATQPLMLPVERSAVWKTSQTDVSAFLDFLLYHCHAFRQRYSAVGVEFVEAPLGFVRGLLVLAFAPALRAYLECSPNLWLNKFPHGNPEPLPCRRTAALPLRSMRAVPGGCGPEKAPRLW